MISRFILKLKKYSVFVDWGIDLGNYFVLNVEVMGKWARYTRKYNSDWEKEKVFAGVITLNLLVSPVNPGTDLRVGGENLFYNEFFRHVLLRMADEDIRSFSF